MRKRYVTRTIVGTKANVLCLNTRTVEPYNKDFTISGTFDNDENLLKALRKGYETEEEKLVQIVSVTPETVRYGMEEEKFIAMAEILPLLEKADKDENDNE